MCRLFGYASTDTTTVEATLGASALEQFTQLSRLHGDGWGTAWWAQGSMRTGGQQAYRSPGPAYSDPQFAEQTRLVPATARIVHLRWATPGLAVNPVNTHPFLADGMSFAHNGSLMPPGAVADLLKPEFQDSLVGNTDSERYFALIRQEMAAGSGDTVAAAGRAVRTLRASFPIASLNALLLTPTEMIVVHANSIEDTPELKDAAGMTVAPLDHLEAYYLMRWRREADHTIAFTSSGLPDAGWIPLPDDSVTRVDLADLSMTTHLVEHDGATTI
jgi:predicted glutamine amidotransferase